MNNLKSALIEKFDINDYNNVYVVGDIHGEVELLKAGLSEIGFKEDDLLVCVGDLIDRGSNSLEVIEFILNTPNAISCLGNHEVMAILFLLYGINDEYDAWMHSGGSWIHNHQHDMAHLKGLFERIEKEFPLCLDLDYLGKKLLVSHSAIPGYSYDCLVKNKDSFMNKLWLFSKHEDLETIEEMLENTDDYEDEIDMFDIKPVSGADLTIHGHTGTLKPALVSNRLYIDTRAFKDAGMGEGAKNFLTLLCLNKDTGADFVHFKKDHFMSKTQWLDDVDNQEVIKNINNILFDGKL